MNELPEIPQFSPEPPTSLELLQQLCERQREELNRLNDHYAKRHVQHTEEMMAILREGQRRQAVLHSLQQKVAKLYETTKRVVSERDQLESALRGLLLAFDKPAVQAGKNTWGGEVFRALREADELVAVIDQIRAARGEQTGG